NGVISKQEFDSIRDRTENARASLANAKARLEAQKLAVRDAEARVKQQEVVVKDAERAVKTAEINVSSTQARANQQAASLRGQKNQRDKS
ncbi:hypothetical protein OFM36_33285, partial [Escherichia coli]|nr:hypothetical protein [Escherichia coli]